MQTIVSYTQSNALTCGEINYLNMLLATVINIKSALA